MTASVVPLRSFWSCCLTPDRSHGGTVWTRCKSCGAYWETVFCKACDGRTWRRVSFAPMTRSAVSYSDCPKHKGKEAS